MTASTIFVNVPSLEKAADTLREAAIDMQAGQADLFVLDWAGAPRSHPDVAKAMRGFGEFAHEQYRATIALLVALASRVSSAAAGYRSTDQAISKLLGAEIYRPAG